MTQETLENSHRFATTNIGIDVGTNDKEASATGIPLIEIRDL